MQLIRLTILMSLLFRPGISEAALTLAQLKQIRTAINQMEQALSKMMILTMATEQLLNNGNAYTVAFSTVPIPLNSQQQQDIVNYYQSLKAQLQTQYGDLP